MHGFMHSHHGLHHAHAGGPTRWRDTLKRRVQEPAFLALAIAAAVILGLIVLTMSLPMDAEPQYLPQGFPIY